MNQRIIRNARIVTASDTFLGCAVVEGGSFRAIDWGGSSSPAAEDWEGDWLLPGLVEMHTDNLEKHLVPRPGVIWNATSATVTHDAQCAAAGITTVLDSIVIGDMDQGGTRSQTYQTSIDALHACREAGLMRVEHLLHLRCEVSAPDIVENFERYADDPLVELVSVMDHTPGQRQWRDLAKYRRYSERNGSLRDEEYERMVRERTEQQARFAARHRAQVVAGCHARGIPLASHDDTEIEHVALAREEKVAMSEFPTTVRAAEAARAAGMAIVMGGPNLVKGGSHSGNVAAAELAARDLLDILSSDYVPSSLLQSAFLLRDQLGWTPPRAVATVSLNPAQALGLPDRGEIAPGRRADFIRVREVGGMPVVRGAWCRGERAF
ncbi:alpha-D-ribose 1-methylphosphonate 5-triphosphate diphosphatase [Ramlibacter tataouinensis]|uniref:Candidate PhnM protein n=1 Tax=Ramlibacter tataouinensis (strain ATCC BAA-407 / DSM 14655 / LMG 21543 / TTB310) TaxID=365046 RepID=F5XZX8_RAMTT|nr:alpha-D-ribose 1-methylphosphonate 5-triphosphate diphosphatase [Ramlibacter tataouinensis]AEG93339.1 Candidate PhnM protein [Ramlibacter tataouinensis TTB310]